MLSIILSLSPSLPLVRSVIIYLCLFIPPPPHTHTHARVDERKDARTHTYTMLHVLISKLKRRNGCTICHYLVLPKHGPLSCIQERSSSTSSFHASLLQAIGGVMSLVLCLQIGSQAPQRFRSSRDAINQIRDASHLWWLLWPPVYLLGPFPSRRLVQGVKLIHVGASLSSKVGPPHVKTARIGVRSQPPASQSKWKQSLMPSAGLPQEVTQTPSTGIRYLSFNHCCI